eukprot:scaffold928_cov370-Prasinococcus_capsulatus_cf.AAC.24
MGSIHGSVAGVYNPYRIDARRPLRRGQKQRRPRDRHCGPHPCGCVAEPPQGASQTLQCVSGAVRAPCNELPPPSVCTTRVSEPSSPRFTSRHASRIANLQVRDGLCESALLLEGGGEAEMQRSGIGMRFT